MNFYGALIKSNIFWKRFFEKYQKIHNKQTYNKLIDKICIRPKVECTNVMIGKQCTTVFMTLAKTAIYGHLYTNYFLKPSTPIIDLTTRRINVSNVKPIKKLVFIYFIIEKDIWLLQTTRSEMVNKNILLTKQAFWFDKNLSNDDLKTMAIFLYSIWRKKA
jgi:hypothetical protein